MKGSEYWRYTHVPGKTMDYGRKGSKMHKENNWIDVCFFLKKPLGMIFLDWAQRLENQWSP